MFINKKAVQKKRNLCDIDSFHIFWKILTSLYAFLRDRDHARDRFHVPDCSHVHGHFLYHNYVFPPTNVLGLPCVRLQMNIHLHDDYLELRLVFHDNRHNGFYTDHDDAKAYDR